MGLNLRKTFCVTLYITYTLIISQNCFGQFISNHFELENDVKMTPKRRLLLSALFFTCFFALLFLLENQAGASAVRVNKQLGYGVATWKRGHHYIYIYITISHRNISRGLKLIIIGKIYLMNNIYKFWNTIELTYLEIIDSRWCYHWTPWHPEFFQCWSTTISKCENRAICKTWHTRHHNFL